MYIVTDNNFAEIIMEMYKNVYTRNVLGYWHKLCNNNYGGVQKYMHIEMYIVTDTS